MPEAGRQVQPLPEEQRVAGMASVRATERRRRKGWTTAAVTDQVAEECPVALAYNGISHAVMMATPVDLEDLGRGFSLSEGIVRTADDIFGITVTGDLDSGYTVDLHIHGACLDNLKRQHRHMAGPTGCGLCGKDSLAAVLQPLEPLPEGRVPQPAVIELALQALPEHQPIQQQTGACHAAVWCSADGEILVSREDVGRHNALDKLIGALARQGALRPGGFALVSSRASYELVYKAVRARMPTLVAVSGVTRMAVQMAADNNLNLIGFARPGRQMHYG